MDVELEAGTVRPTTTMAGGSGFVISTRANAESQYVRYETTAVDDELATDEIAAARMEDELAKLKTANADELEATLLQPQEAISRSMMEEFRLRKLDAALSDLHKKRESRPGSPVLTDADEIAVAVGRSEPRLPEEIDMGEEQEFEAYEAIVLKRAMANSRLPS